MFLSNSLYIGKSYTIFFYEKVVKWCSYQKLHKNPCEYKAPINSQPIRTGKFINFLIYMIVYSAWKRYNVRENTNMHILFGNYSEKIVYVCCRSLRGSVDWNIFNSIAYSCNTGRSLRGSVDWNCEAVEWVIGQRSRSLRGSVDWNMKSYLVVLLQKSRSLRGSVDWNAILAVGVVCVCHVAPSAGAWIEIIDLLK